MNKDYISIAISFVAAILAIFLRERFARLIINFQNTVWGFNFGEREIKASKIVIIIVAIAIIIFDILQILNIGKPKY